MWATSCPHYHLTIRVNCTGYACLERAYSKGFEYSESKDDFIIHDNLLQIDEFLMNDGYIITVNDIAINEYCEQVGLEAEELIQIYQL